MIKLILYIYNYDGVIVVNHNMPLSPATAVAPESIAVHLERAPEEEYWPLTLADADAWDLSYMNDSWCADNLSDGLRAVIRANALPSIKSREINVWKYLSEYSPPANRGFLFSAGDNEIVTLVQDQMEIGHSGCSMGWTMRNIEFIAKNGLPAHREMFLTRNK